MEISLKGKKAFVCGSTQGIGKAAAIELASLGATVVLLARNEESLKKTIKELNTDVGQKHDYIVTDFSNPSSLKEKVNAYLQKNNQPVHILVNNTGGPPGGKAIDARPEDFQSALNSHLMCNHILVQALVEGMKKEKYGRIINIISTSVKQPISGLGVSNTTRWAVASWAKTLAGELGSFGITVNNVLPGATRTQRLQSLNEAQSKATGKSVNDIEAGMLRDIPAGRFAEANEVANAIAFLASPAASYINGINVPVDGGRTKSL
jgi:3-oxoacyl-[acyl-carrier protein] reductase